MAQVIAKVAHAEDETWWLNEAKQRTVREMRTLVKEREGAGPMSAVEEELQATLTVTVDAEDGRLFECARMLGKQQGDGTLGETLEGLLAEGTTSLLAELGRDSTVSMAPFDDAVDEDAPQRAWEKQLAQFREEAEERCELALGDEIHANGVDATVDLRVSEMTWDGDAEGIDAHLRSIAAELARRDLLFGEAAERFWAADRWRRLGFATESQYARERLGMSLSAVKAKRALARRARALPWLREAVDVRALGYEAARLVAKVASRETAPAWVARAGERTVKHLREEVDVAEMLARIGVEPAMVPPSVATMERLATFERRIVTGAALQPDESQMSAGDGETYRLDGDASDGLAELNRTPRRAPESLRLQSRGRVTLRFRVSTEVKRYYRWLERMYVHHGPRDGGFFRYLCLSFIGVWRHRATFSGAYSRVYERDLYRCTNPVCTRRDVTPHHLVFRSAGGDDSDENVASLCVWCHLEGVHGGVLRVEPPASAMQWRIGRRGHTVVTGRRRKQLTARRTCRSDMSQSGVRGTVV
jgi:hypothetical protein